MAISSAIRTFMQLRATCECNTRINLVTLICSHRLILCLMKSHKHVHCQKMMQTQLASGSFDASTMHGNNAKRWRSGVLQPSGVWSQEGIAIRVLGHPKEMVVDLTVDTDDEEPYKPSLMRSLRHRLLLAIGLHQALCRSLCMRIGMSTTTRFTNHL